MNRLVAWIYDPFMRASEEACLRQWRAELLGDLHGRVLELGAGTGSALPCYPDALERLVLVEPDPRMRKQCVARIPARLQPVVEVSDGRAEALPFDDASFDAVVCSLVLCSVPDLPGTLAELWRVLVPGGRLLFLEHVADDERPDRLRWQRRLEPVWKRVAGNCHLTRRTDQAIVEAGFCLGEVTRASIRKSIPLTRRSVRGVAIKPHA